MTTLAADVLVEDLDPDLVAAAAGGEDPVRFLKRARAGISAADPALVDEAVRRACATDFKAFLRYEMGMEVAEFHSQWADDLEDGRRRGLDVCILAPRDHGKSLTAVRCWGIYRAKYDPHVREVYVIGADQEGAVENLDKIKELLLTRRALRDLVPGNWKEGFNNRLSIRLTNGVLFRAKPFFSRLRGRHPQLILCDDVLNEQNSDSEEKRRKAEQQIGAVLLPMKDKGSERARAAGYRPQVVFIGTAQHSEDAYHKMLGRQTCGPSLNPQIVGRKQSAIIVDDSWEPVPDAAGEPRVLWPGRYDFDSLMDLKADPRIGTLLFEREYMNKPIVDEMAIFPPSLFRPLLDEELSYRRAYSGDLPTFLGMDLSVPGNRDGDWTVSFVLSYDPDEQVFTPLNYWRARPATIQEQFRVLELHCQAYRVQLAYVEDNAFQATFAHQFQQKSTLPVQGLTTTRGRKNSYLGGILGLRPLFEAGRWRFPYRTERDRQMTDLLVREFGGITQRDGKLGNEAAHDDVPMALWFAWRAAMDVVAGGAWDSDWSVF